MDTGFKEFSIRFVVHYIEIRIVNYRKDSFDIERNLKYFLDPRLILNNAVNIEEHKVEHKIS